MNDLSSLIERVERATGPDRTLDLALAQTLAPDVVVMYQRPDDEGADPYTHWEYTGKIDDALALKDRLLPGQACAVGDMAFEGTHNQPWATIWSLEGSPRGNEHAATPALAIILALLTALQSSHPATASGIVERESGDAQ